MFVSAITGPVRSTVKFTTLARQVAALVTLVALSIVLTQSFFAPSVRPVAEPDHVVVPVARVQPLGTVGASAA